MQGTLELIANKISEEIKDTGTLTINGNPMVRSVIKGSSPFKNLCRESITKAINIASKQIHDFSVDLVSAMVDMGGGLNNGIHILGRFKQKGLVYFMDITGQQYGDQNNIMVYGPYGEDEPNSDFVNFFQSDHYPLNTVPGRYRISEDFYVSGTSD